MRLEIAKHVGISGRSPGYPIPFRLATARTRAPHRLPEAHHSALIFATRITLAHFSTHRGATFASIGEIDAQQEPPLPNRRVRWPPTRPQRAGSMLHLHRAWGVRLLAWRIR